MSRKGGQLQRKAKKKNTTQNAHAQIIMVAPVVPAVEVLKNLHSKVLMIQMGC